MFALSWLQNFSLVKTMSAKKNETSWLTMFPLLDPDPWCSVSWRCQRLPTMLLMFLPSRSSRGTYTIYRRHYQNIEKRKSTKFWWIMIEKILGKNSQKFPKLWRNKWQSFFFKSNNYLILFTGPDSSIDLLVTWLSRPFYY